MTDVARRAPYASAERAALIAEYRAHVAAGQSARKAMGQLGVTAKTFAVWLEKESEQQQRSVNDRPARRKCLSCGRTFASRGPGHRRCEPCAGNRLVDTLPASLAEAATSPVWSR